MYNGVEKKGYNYRLILWLAVLTVCIYLAGCAGPGEKVSAIPEEETTAQPTEEGGLESAVKTGSVVTILGGSQQLTSGDYNNGIGSFHPDGDRIVFQSDRDGHWQIYELDLALNSERKVIESDANDENPVWTPDGSLLLFVSDRDGGGEEWARDIYSYDPATGLVTRLTTSPADDWFPVPIGGSSFIFLSEREANRNLSIFYRQNSMYIGFADGSEPVKLAGMDLDISSPAEWDSDRFVIRSSDGRFEIWSSEDGSIEPLTPPYMKCGTASIDRNSDRIVFNAREQGDYQLYIMDLNTKTMQQLDSAGGDVRYPQFSSDGSGIIYTAGTDGYFQLYQLSLE